MTRMLIASLKPIYDTFARLCQETGTWQGDIYQLRKAFSSKTVQGDIITRQLESLQRRGLLTFTAEKRSHKAYYWTVTLHKRGVA